MTVLLDSWIRVSDGDPRAVALYRRHYSCRKVYGQKANWRSGPGERMVLLTPECDGLFIWRWERHRRDKQEGINCAVFRNEGPRLSSDLIREASERAWVKWPGERLFTFVADYAVKSVNPGYCFKMAGWRRCGRTKGGLTILEMLPTW